MQGRIMTQDSEDLWMRRAKSNISGKDGARNIGKNNGRPKSHHAQMASLHLPAFLGMIKSHDGLLPRDVGRSNGGARVASKGKVIPAHRYAAYMADERNP